jgi:hypothetical protein
MAFTIPEDLHPDLYSLAWLVGTWRGNGIGEYPGIPRFNFFQEVTFNHDGRNFLNYFSRTWKVDEVTKEQTPFELETGFWTPKEEKALHVVISSSRGISEGWLGIHDGPRIQLVMDRGYSSPSAPIVTAGQRLYGLVEGELFFSYDMASEGETLQAYMWSTMERA